MPNAACAPWPSAEAFLFVGSERAGHAAATYNSLVESCKANKVNPLTHLTYVLTNARNKSMSLPAPDQFTDLNVAHFGDALTIWIMLVQTARRGFADGFNWPLLAGGQ